MMVDMFRPGHCMDANDYHNNDDDEDDDDDKNNDDEVNTDNEDNGVGANDDDGDDDDESDDTPDPPVFQLSSPRSALRSYGQIDKSGQRTGRNSIRGSETRGAVHERGGKQRLLDEQLFEAASQGRADDVETLLLLGANPNATQHNGVSVLHASVVPGNERVCEMLLLADADVQSTLPVCLWTPLHRASASGATGCVAALLKWGAVVDQPKRDGQTPLDLARLNCRRDSEELLLLHQPASSSGPVPLTPTVRVPTLRQLAAVALRKRLGRRRSSHVDLLDLPDQLKRYINHGKPFERRQLDTRSGETLSGTQESMRNCEEACVTGGDNSANNSHGDLVSSLLPCDDTNAADARWWAWWFQDWRAWSSGGLALLAVSMAVWLRARRRML